MPFYKTEKRQSPEKKKYRSRAFSHETIFHRSDYGKNPSACPIINP
jgi:hypothetical protein